MDVLRVVDQVQECTQRGLAISLGKLLQLQNDFASMLPLLPKPPRLTLALNRSKSPCCFAPVNRLLVLGDVEDGSSHMVGRFFELETCDHFWGSGKTRYLKALALVYLRKQLTFA
jgi:hypothetical protein